jgi:hypothetical protein
VRPYFGPQHRPAEERDCIQSMNAAVTKPRYWVTGGSGPWDVY